MGAVVNQIINDEVAKARADVLQYGGLMYPTGKDRAALCHAAVILDRAVTKLELANKELRDKVKALNEDLNCRKERKKEVAHLRQENAMLSEKRRSEKERADRLAIRVQELEGKPKQDVKPVGGNYGHGHVWERPDGVKMRCGGPAMCKECALDHARETKAPEAQPCEGCGVLGGHQSCCSRVR